MGQGYSLTTLSAGAAGIDVPELADLTYEKSLGDARFMKAIRARHHDGLVVTKVVMKPYSSMEFGKYITEINRERKILAHIPNTLGYHRAFETSSNGFLVRQYIYSSIYDRLSTRPFLEDIEKKWLAFQLLYAIRDCHVREIYHGDIKTENTLVTSWNWLYLSDFSSSFKPTFLPEDNPADFSFYFDIAGRRTCYVAPERFLKPGEKPEGRQINWAMDIFSVGCVIAELFLETPIFNLSQLFNYRKGEYDPNQLHLSRIEDKDIRELIAHMIQLEPESRYSADEYLNFWRNRVFPDYFYSFLHQYMYLITDSTSGRSPITTGAANLGESDDRIDRVFHDFDKISFFLGYDEDKPKELKIPSKLAFNQLFPLHLDIPNKRQISTAIRAPLTDDGTLLFLSIVTSALRSTARATARIRAFELLLAFSERVTDETKLDRILPYVMALVHDPADIIKVAALRTLTQLTALVSTTSPINAYLFPEYILPRLEGLSPLSGRNLSPLVRATYALCLATLAESASRFLDVTQAYKAEGSLTTTDTNLQDGAFIHAYQDLYDSARVDLVRTFEAQTKALLTDPNPDVRRAFLGSVSSLCVFFGSAKANDVILSHLNTYLNDRDWKLKCAFFETIVGVAIYVGSTNLEEFILPLMVQALSDPEETVVEKVLRSLATMAQLGLFQRSRSWALIDVVARFTMHPNIWIREAAAHFLSSVVKFVSAADCQCIVQPLLKPYMRTSPSSFSETILLDTLKKPLPRAVFDSAVQWADKVSDGPFWKSVKQRMTSNLMEDRIPVAPSVETGANALSRVQKSTEDVKWITRLRTLGMESEDEFKLMALREYILRVSKRQAREGAEISDTIFNTKIVLKDLGLDLQTVFFDRGQQTIEEGGYRPGSATNNGDQPQSIEHALRDASIAKDSLLPNRHPAGSSPSKRNASKDNASRIPSPFSVSPGMQAEIPNSMTRDKDAQDLLNVSNPGLPLSSSADSGLLSPMDSASLHSHNHIVSRKGSAMDLMQRKVSVAKAGAETSTSSANAVGQPYSRDAKVKVSVATVLEDVSASPNHIRFQTAHTYGGRDPSVLKLLDAVYIENYPADVVEFGPMVTPVRKKPRDQRLEATPDKRLRPTGTLVAMFGEHTAPVNRVVASPDHLFFITGSDDGCVKVWDCARLERNLAHRSRQTYKHSADSKITSLCFVENTHCFVSTGSDGSVHIVKVDCVETAQGTTKYGKPRPLRQWHLPTTSSFAVWTEHFKVENQSILIIATNMSQILAIDISTMDVLYNLENPLHHGTPTCFCLDTQKHWLLLGTSHGVLDLWDLRFRIRLKAWGFPGASPIHRLSLHPRYGKVPNDKDEQPPKPVCVAGGTGSNEVTVWDLNKAVCLEVFRTVPTTTNAPSSSTSVILPDTKPYTFQNIDATPSAKLLTRFANNLPLSSPMSTDRGVRAITVSSSSPSFLVAAGSDRKVRFWNLADLVSSCVVSGLEAEEGSPTYTTLGTPLQPKIHEERAITRDQERERMRLETLNPLTGAPVGGQREGARLETREAIKPSRTTVIGEQQARLLRNHLDVLLDVAVIEFPARMVISVDRSGMVYVFA